PDKTETGLIAGAGKGGIFGEEAVSRMDGVDVVLAGEGDDALNVEVRPNRFARLADPVGFVRLEAVQREAILVRIDGDGPNAQFVRGTEHADGDLAPIGNQQFADRMDGGDGRFLRRHEQSLDQDSTGG